MRDIEFRGKSIKDGEWLYGYYCFVGYTNKEKHYIIPYYSSVFYGIEVLPETVGQYIGQKDINGIRIYEKDILNRYGDNYNGVVEWCNEDEGIEGSGWCIHEYYPKKFGDKFHTLSAYTTNKEVIGNLIDNPELKSRYGTHFLTNFL